MIIRVTHDKENRPIKRMFRKPLKTYTREIKEFDGYCEGLQNALIHIYGIPHDTPYFKIEKVYDPQAERPQIEEVHWVSELIRDVHYSAKAVALREERARMENKASEKDIREQIEKGVQWRLKSALEKVSKKIAAEVLAEMAETADE